jgi:hypothetical protein
MPKQMTPKSRDDLKSTCRLNYATFALLLGFHNPTVPTIEAAFARPLQDYPSVFLFFP